MCKAKFDLDYYYGQQAEQFTFFRIPKMLFRNKDISNALSCESKLLYGLMLDRMSLSISNNWLDDKRRAFIIYTSVEIQNEIGCGNQKVAKLLAELENIGLIERKKRGLGRADIIYVKNFSQIPLSNSVQNYISRELDEPEKCENHISADDAETGVQTQKCENHISRDVKITLQEMLKSHANNTNINNTDLNNIYPVNHINPVESSEKIDGQDKTESAEVYKAIVRKNIEYEYWEKNRSVDWEIYDEIYHLICDIVCVPRVKVRINGVDYPYRIVKEKFLTLNYFDIEYVIQKFTATTTEVKNVRAYLLTSLYNAHDTINSYYCNAVNHDMSTYAAKDHSAL